MLGRPKSAEVERASTNSSAETRRSLGNLGKQVSEQLKLLHRPCSRFILQVPDLEYSDERLPNLGGLIHLVSVSDRSNRKALQLYIASQFAARHLFPYEI